MGAPLYLRHPSSLDHDTGAHPENRERIPAIELELEAHDWLGYEVREAPPVAPEALLAVHPPEQIEAVRSLSERGGWFDADTVAGPGSYDAALHAAGAACALAEAIMSGAAPTGFCGARPPGHHAEASRAMGFCLFNNVAIAARHALDSLGARRVLVLDWDVHHGNGTEAIFAESSEVLYASLHEWPLYPGTGPLEYTGSGAGEGFTINLPVPARSGGETWLPLVEHIVVPAALAFEPDLVLVSAGFDGHRDDPLALCELDEAAFAGMALHVRALADRLGARCGAVLEGGYDLRALARSVAVTMEALAEGGEPPHSAPGEAVARAAAVHGRHWPVGGAA